VQGGAPLVVVDFSGLTFLDSTGVNCLVRARADGDAAGTRLLVRNATGIARRVLEITGLAELLCEEPGRGGDRHLDGKVGS
jgi:anti-sigma B factor antagonist